MFFPPFSPPGVFADAVGTLTLGSRKADFEDGPSPVTVPRADELDELKAAFAAGNSTIVEGKWWFAADDVRINGVSTGACAEGAPNNTLGKCLVFSDTGSPRTTVPPEVLTSDQQNAFDAWMAADSFSPDVPYARCNETSTIPLNLSISVGGLWLSLTPPDMAVKVAENHAGEEVCYAWIDVNSIQSGFDDPSNPAYALPAPALFVGNNWLRNFYVTHTTRTTEAPASMTFGCAKDGLGECQSDLEYPELWKDRRSPS